jgi:uncharacterized protein
MIELRKIVLDVLKPHEPDITVLSKTLASLDGVEGVNISVYEIDQRVENVKVTLVGRFPDITRIRKVILDAGGTIHSIDAVMAGKTLVEEEASLQDRMQEHD